MAPAQVVQFELLAPTDVRVRDDVEALFVLVTDHGRPVELLRMKRPPGGVLSLTDIPKVGRRRLESSATAAAPEKAVIPISVVIPTRERPEDLSRCLERLRVAGTDDYEVIVVDNAPVTDRTLAVTERFGVRRVLEPKPGINSARNAGVAAARRGLVAFVDDDAVVSPGWLKAISDCFQDPSIGCVTGLVLPLELETQAQDDFERYCHQRRDLTPRIYSRDILRPSAAGVVGMGANMAFRRDLIIDLGWFDPRLGTGTTTRGGDENDMFARVLDAGWRIAYSPDAYVWHRHRRTSEEVRSCVFGYGIGVYSMLTKRLLESRDLGAIVTAGRWLLGPPVKAARAKMTGAPSPPWRVVFAETAGAPLGPFFLWYETWRRRGRQTPEKGLIDGGD
jgi:GT2 family glycosyltransferase